MAALSPEAIKANRRKLGLDDEHIPRSVAIIMDGNGRWARKRGLSRPLGHEEGAKTVRKIITEGANLGLQAMSFYSFSIENWNRPKDEVNALMHLYAHCLVQERETIMEHNIRLRHLGRRGGLPQSVIRELDETVRVSSGNTGMHLCLAINYGSRSELVDAVRRIARRVAHGEIEPVEIDEAMISDSLDSSGIPDPDLLIRTSGEMRLSNFMLWQLSYAEFYVTDTYWPDFNEEEFHKALKSFSHRNRRFGGVDETNE